ncbi:MAG: CpaF family protein [Planctomycetia bacterium]|nr:CpaF family protein [Planctomycetia bacterium]
MDKARRRIHKLFVERVEPQAIDQLSEEERRPRIRSVLEQLVRTDSDLLTFVQQEKLVTELLDDILGFGPLEPLLRDPTVSDVLINGLDTVYVERAGVLEEIDVHFRDEMHLMDVIRRIVSRIGRRIDQSSPMVDARLPDGSRFNAVIPPLAVDGPMVSIRRFGKNPLTVAALESFKAISPQMLLYLRSAVIARLNILISGGTGSGKTTILNALSSFIPPRERIVTIEDAAELHLQQRHVGRLEARPANVEDKGEVTIRGLVRNALRMRPDRIVIGECRGEEALDMLQAMNTGHEGSMTTLHANSPRDALLRLETMVVLASAELPLPAVRQQIASAIDVVVQVARLPGGVRRVVSIAEVTGTEEERIALEDLFAFEKQGVDTAGKCYGRFVATGAVSRHVRAFQVAGVPLPDDLFQPRVLLEA